MGLEDITEQDAKNIFWNDLGTSLIVEGIKIYAAIYSSLASAEAIGNNNMQTAGLWGVLAMTCFVSSMYNSVLVWRDFYAFKNDTLAYVKKYENEIMSQQDL